MKYRYHFNEHIMHVKGAFNDALYDLNDGAVYSLTGLARDIIRKINAPEPDSLEKHKRFLEKLESINIVTFAPEKPKPIVIKRNKIVLRQMWLSLNSNCNLKCAHCYAESEPKPSDFSLSDDTIFNAVRDGVEHYGLEFVQLIGGEPLLLGINRLRRLIAGIKQIGIKEIEIYTNAIPVTERHLELFKEFDISVAVSIYSYRPREHDAITQRKGSWNKTIANVDKMFAENVKLRFGVVIMEKNAGIADEIKPWLDKRYKGKVSTGVDVVRTCGRGNDIDAVPWEKFQNRHFRKDNKNFMPATIETLQTTLYNNICWGGLVCVHPNGDITPCEMEFSAIQGNINNNTLHEIISSNQRKGQRLTKDNIEICKACEYRYVCWECRAMANSLSNKENVKPKTCMYDPTKGIWQDAPTKGSFFNVPSSR